MWFIRLEVRATATNSITHPEMGRAKGAYVNCLIDFRDKSGAASLAQFYAAADGQWKLRRLIEVRRVAASSFKGDRQYLKYFREAGRKGFSIVFYMYPRANSRLVAEIERDTSFRGLKGGR